ENHVLPLAKDMTSLLVAGKAADDLGMHCGGWSIEWQGGEGAITTGTTILKAVQEAVSEDTAVHYRPDGDFLGSEKADIGIVVVGEKPYAEGFGDNGKLTLSEEDVALLHKMRGEVKQLVVILLSGRPL